MTKADTKLSHVDHFPPPPQDEEAINVAQDWTPEEERRAKRK